MRLLLSFTVHLENYDIDELVRPKGPLFHRWLPDGELDALVLQTGDNRKQIKLWFERSGFVDRGFIKYDRVRQEVDGEIMKRQGHLDAGQLWGECRFGYLTVDEVKAIREGRTGANEYIAVGKRIAAFVHSVISYFIDTLRFKYGQYWLSELPAWDSRTQSLGAYCANTLWLR